MYSGSFRQPTIHHFQLRPLSACVCRSSHSQPAAEEQKKPDMSPHKECSEAFMKSLNVLGKLPPTDHPSLPTQITFGMRLPFQPFPARR
uniref:Predicted protein n=1 Tax=Hordeum vulgare subsp. vulgare TaxID=112509 RepID=F2EHQ9_HORVV|nr:predicted protein [Hordeum vulgare subsp. vulgare]